MRHSIRRTALLLTAIIAFGPHLLLQTPALAAATITIVNADGPGEGFNDPTPAAPVGGNTATTLGEQRLIALQHAASLWGAALDSSVEIHVLATFDPLICTAFSVSLGAASNAMVFANFPGALFPDTWHPSALANKLAGVDLSPSAQGLSGEEIVAVFNSSIGTADCLTGLNWFYGLDNNHGSNIDLVTVALHELGHGLGFSTSTNPSTGQQLLGRPHIYDSYVLDIRLDKTWDQMTDAERAFSAFNSPLAWAGPAVTANVQAVLDPGTPFLRVNSPAAIAGAYHVGTASFGPPLTSSGVTGDVVQALDAGDVSGPSTLDGCSALTNPSEVAGRIALIDRGQCTFVAKVKNAQNAGAIAVIIANNASGSPPPGLGGSDPTITIPAVSVTLSDGNIIKAELATGIVNATLHIDLTVRLGADAAGRALLHAPNPLQPGRSVTHWDPIASPDQLMEPPDVSLFLIGELSHGLNVPDDLTLPLLRDVGWFPDGDLDGLADESDNCPAVANSDQADADGDGIGDACDGCTDTDGDGFGDPGFPANSCAIDNCPAQSNPGQADADADGIGDACDICPTDAPRADAGACGCGDADGDGQGDACDACTDTDGDGFGNPGFPANTCARDNCPADANPDQADADGDGFGDLCDTLVRLVSVNGTGTDSGNTSSRSPVISADGRFVAFQSGASDLVLNDTNGTVDVYVRDLMTGTTTLVSVNGAETGSGNTSSDLPVISADGRFVAFESSASDLGPNDTNRTADVYVRDLLTDTTMLVSVNNLGTNSGNTSSGSPISPVSISADGRFVAFQSGASDLVLNDTNGTVDVYVRDLMTGTTTLVSVNGAGTGSGNSGSESPVISADGRFVAFVSSATDLGPNDTNGRPDIYVRDLMTGTTMLGSVNNLGTNSGNSSSGSPVSPVSISGDGRFVAFESSATDLVPNDTNGVVQDVYVRDLMTGTTTLVSVDGTGMDSGNNRSESPVISADGRFVAFVSIATDLVLNDTNGVQDVYVHDLMRGTTTLVSVNGTGMDSGNNRSESPVISADGRFVAFESRASDLGPSDTNGQIMDVYLRDLMTGTTTLVSVNGAGTGSGNTSSVLPVISADGRFVAFESGADNLVPHDTNSTVDVFISPVDSDRDGVPNVDDNCPVDGNLDQADADGDGIGDACDNRPPVADAGPDQTVECAGHSGTPVTLDGLGSSDPDGNPLTYDWTGPFGSVSGVGPMPSLPLGTHIVTLTVSDGRESATDEVIITVRDTTPPAITPPPDLTVEATGCCGQPVSIGTATATDACDPSPRISSDAPGLFPIGMTVVTWTATDAIGNAASATQQVTVQDTTPPVIDPHDDVIIEATDSDGAVCSYTFPATSDAVDGTGAATCSPASGATCALGDTTVTCTASDSHANAADPTTFVVHVVDTTPPETLLVSVVDENGTALNDGALTTSTSITFTFAGTDIVQVFGFECSTDDPLDSPVFTPCTSPHTLTDVATGNHLFRVRAVDTAGNPDPMPASFSWEVFVLTDPDGDSTATYDGDGNTIVTTTDETGQTVAEVTLPPGSDVSSGELQVNLTERGRNNTLQVSGVTVPYPPGKSISVRSNPGSNLVCILDSPQKVEVVGLPSCGSTDTSISQVVMQCSEAGVTQTLTGFPDEPSTRTYTCTKTREGGRDFMKVDGLAFSFAVDYDACPTASGSAQRQGCAVAGKHQVRLVVIDRLNSGACPGGAFTCVFPARQADVRVYDRKLLQDLVISTLDGGSVKLLKNIDTSLFNDIFESLEANAQALGAALGCITDGTGTCFAGEEAVGDYLVIVRYRDESGANLYGAQLVAPRDYVDTNADGAPDLATKTLTVYKVIR